MGASSSSSAKTMYFPIKDYVLHNIDLLTLIFESPLAWSKEEMVLHAEAALPSNCITKSEARTITKRLIHLFRDQFGIGKSGSGKDVVVCMTLGQILSASIFFGIIGAGGVFSAASPSYTVAELVRQIKQGGATLLIVSEELKETAVAAANECGIPLNKVLVFQSMGGPRFVVDATGTSRNYFNDTKEMEWERITDRKKLEESLVCLLYSSGTTGVPKGVNVSHFNLVQEALIPHLQDREYFVKRQRADPSYIPSYSTIAHLPTAHIAGVQLYFINSSVAGGPVYWMPKFDFPQFVKYNEKFATTFLFSVPPVFLLIAKTPWVKDQFRSVEQCISGAAPLGNELQGLVEKKLGIQISQTWGLSEATGSITMMPRDTHDPTGSVGPLLPNVRLRIVDEEENDVEEGSEGEMLLQGPMITKGYYKNEAATKESFTPDGWFRTGDIGVRRDGKFYIVDRKKEMIKYKGLQVAPAELEALLLSHNLILDAAVIGIPDSESPGNELPRAYVVADQGKISAEEIQEFVKTNLAHYKQLRGGVRYVDVIPKSPSGKILRREIRDQARREVAQGRARL